MQLLVFACEQDAPDKLRQHFDGIFLADAG